MSGIALQTYIVEEERVGYLPAVFKFVHVCGCCLFFSFFVGVISLLFVFVLFHCVD